MRRGLRLISRNEAGSTEAGGCVAEARRSEARRPGIGGLWDRVSTLQVLPFAVMTLIATIDLSTGPNVGLLPLVSLGPAFAGLVGGWRRMLLVGVLSLALCVGLGLYDGFVQHGRGFMAMGTVVGVTAAGVVATVMRQRQEAAYASVSSIAEVAQRVLLRPVPRSAGRLRVAVSYTSAVADARIGGDLYEVVAMAAGVRVIVGDVQGKGLEAVETAAHVLGAFREPAHEEPDLPSVSTRLERAANRELQGEKFVTAILAEVDHDEQVTLLNYGHPPPLLIRRDGTATFVEPPFHALPLGLLNTHGGPGPEPHRLDFAPGDQLLLYTDGVSEARDRTGAFYPLEQRTKALLLDEPDPQGALEALRKDLMAYVEGPPHDDAAMLLLRYH
jgi:Stage II sporulation protein E (SpoIIE)